MFLLRNMFFHMFSAESDGMTIGEPSVRITLRAAENVTCGVNNGARKVGSISSNLAHNVAVQEVSGNNVPKHPQV